jgi:arylsulfatase
LIVTPDSPAALATSSAQQLTARGPVAGDVKLSINGLPKGAAHFSGIYGSGESLDVGSDLGSPVSLEYKTPNRFTGKIDKVTITLQ